MEKVSEVTCIICPVGCKARVTIEGKIIQIENLECQAGEDYVKKEIETPMRDFFTTVRIRGARIPILPVRATRPIPKDKVVECASELAKIVLDAPVEAGNIIIKNFYGLETDIIATRSLDRC